MPRVDLDKLTKSVPQMAADQSLIAVPAVPSLPVETAPVCFLPQSWDAAQVIDLASKGGARFLYYEVERLDADEIDVTEESRDHLSDADLASLAKLQSQARRYNTEIEELTLCFVAGGVTHSWSVTAPWASTLRQRLAQLDETVDTNIDTELAEHHGPDRAESARICALLTADLEFRSARTHSHQRKVLLRLAPEVRDEDRGINSTGHDALYNARDQLEEASRETYADYSNRLPELAAELAATPLWGTAATVRLRQIRAENFLTERSGGYPPLSRFVELLLAEPILVPPRRGGVSPAE